MSNLMNQTRDYLQQIVTCATVKIMAKDANSRSYLSYERKFKKLIMWQKWPRLGIYHGKMEGVTNLNFYATGIHVANILVCDELRRC